ncbi:hypothetical protein [Terriglobus sp. RCC_193]|uniref:hypothetical protein n=1 Tax=Terriglobus sp. RCC_193 TaxID=3239218 RepID=UPI00352386F4
MMQTAQHIFDQRSGDVTKAYYTALATCGVEGQLAVALFRAQKRSEAAKSYRRGSSRRASYEVKNWSLSEVCRVLSAPGAPAFRWGWKHDPKTAGYEWVLYVDLPSGQVSFHSADRLTPAPDYPGKYDGHKLSRQRILAYCDAIMFDRQCPIIEGPQQPPEAPIKSLRRRLQWAEFGAIATLFSDAETT